MSSPRRYAVRMAAAGAAATAVQFARARTGYPWFGDLDPSGDFGDAALPAVDLLLMGDSSCTGSGLDGPEEIWIRQLMPRLTASHHVRLRSVAVGGARVADMARDQLPAALEHEWDVVFVSVGANDALRSPSLALVRRTLEAAVDALLERAHVVLLAGAGDLGTPPRMLVPFNWLLSGRSWQVDRMHSLVAAGRDRVHKVDMRANPDPWRAGGDLWAADGFHPNRNGHALWAEAIDPALRDAIAAAVARRGD